MERTTVYSSFSVCIQRNFILLCSRLNNHWKRDNYAPMPALAHFYCILLSSALAFRTTRTRHSGLMLDEQVSYSCL